MGKIKGISVALFERKEVGRDPLDEPIYEEVKTIVKNILVVPASADDITSALNLEGKKAVYILGIPKGDTHIWDNRKVEFFGQTFRAFGKPLEGIEGMMPLDWNKKVMVEAYE